MVKMSRTFVHCLGIEIDTPISYYKKAGVCLSFCLSVTEKFVDLSPSAETRLRRAYFVGQTDTHGRNW